MATQEKVAELRTDVARLRMQFETAAADEQGRWGQRDEDLKAEVREALGEVYAHLNTIQEKLEEDQGAVQVEIGLLRDGVRDSATAATAVTGFSLQAFVASAAVGEKMHLTQRKGFECLPTYGGGALWEWGCGKWGNGGGSSCHAVCCSAQSGGMEARGVRQDRIRERAELTDAL